ncbi:MAG TPA: hypothetical protein VMB52_00285 [Verrucomicrobiae bacterium]|nr:hypothetical protein [Verrucomicrobiae bacterium]
MRRLDQEPSWFNPSEVVWDASPWTRRSDRTKKAEYVDEYRHEAGPCQLRELDSSQFLYGTPRPRPGADEITLIDIEPQHQMVV